MSKEFTLERIWEARRRIYANCGNDPVKLVQYYIERQKENPERFSSKVTQMNKRSRDKNT